MDASDNSRRYSDLSITTTPDPLSGLVMTMFGDDDVVSLQMKSAAWK